MSSNLKIERHNVRLDVWPKSILFPKDHEQDFGEYTIFRATVREIDKIIDPDLDYEMYTASFKGNAPKILTNQHYVVVADEEKDPKYGSTFIINQMYLATNWSDIDQVRKSLKYILTPAIVRKMFSMFEDPTPLLESHDVEGLMSIPGIGESTAQKILQMYDASKDNATAYAEFEELGLTKTFIDKLVKVYKSPDTAVEKVKTNPYCLIKDVRGVGWAKADELANQLGLSPDSDDRIKAFFYYYLSMGLGSSGATFCPILTLF